MVITGVVGTALLFSSHAATPTAAYEAEAGTRSGNASLVSDSGASGSSAVKFSSTASACPVSTPNKPGGPDPWGGCFPGPLSTGVPAGTTLTSYSGCSGGETFITTANTVIDSKTVNCSIIIEAANVMIKNTKVNGGISLDTDNASSSGWSFTLQDSEVDIGVVQLASVAAGNMTVIRSNVHGGETAVQCEEKSTHCDIQDSYLHGQQLPVNAQWHLGGMLSDGGCTGDFNMIPNFATAHNVTATYNLFGANASSAYCTYGGDKPPSPYPHGNHMGYQHNIFQKGTTGHCAAFGPVADFNYSGTGNVWNDNKYDDGSTVVCTAADECM